MATKELIQLKSLFKISVGFTSSDWSLSAPKIFENIALAPDGNIFCAVTYSNIVYLGNTSLNEVIVIHKLESPCTALSFKQKISGSHVVLIGTATGSVISFDSESKKVIGGHVGVGTAFHHISVHPSADRIITSHQCNAVVWTVAGDVSPLHSLKTSDAIDLLRADFGSCGNSIVTIFCDGRILIWDFPTLELLHQLLGTDTSVTTLGPFKLPFIAASVSSCGQFLATIGSLPLLLLLDLKKFTDHLVINLPAECRQVKQMEFLPFTSLVALVFITNDGSLTFYDPIKKSQLKMIWKSKSGCKFIRLAPAYHRSPSTPNQCTMITVDSNGCLNLLRLKVVANGSVSSRQRTRHKSVPRCEALSEQQAVAGSPRTGLDVPRRVAENKIVGPSSFEVVGMTQLENMLHKFGEFPAKYRFTIWRHALNLPMNKEAFSTIVARGLHPAFENLEQVFDVSDGQLLLGLKRMLSALAHWCSLFAEISFLPLLVFPFVKVLHKNLLTCFEVIVTYLVNWAQNWFEYFPAPPFRVLADIEMLVAQDCPQLLEHFKSKGVTAEVYAWPLLKSSLSEIFTEDEWLRVWDHVIQRRDPAFLLAIVAAYSVVSQNTLLRCQEITDFQRFFRDTNPVSLKLLLDKANQLAKVVSSTVSVAEVPPFRPLTRETYPVFYNFPHAAVEVHAHEMRRLRQLEEECFNQKKATLAIEAKYGTVLEQENELRRREAILRSAEFLRRQELLEEEHRLTEQRSRLQVLSAELRERELAVIEANQRRLDREQLLRKEEEIGKLDDELRWRAYLRDSELRDTVERARLQNHQVLIETFHSDAKRRQGGLSTNIVSKGLTESDVSVHGDGSTDSRSRNRSESSESKSSLQSSNVNADHLMQQLSILEQSNRSMEDVVRQITNNLHNSGISVQQ